MGIEGLQKLHLTPNEYGWQGKLPAGSPRLFGRDISLEIHTRTKPGDTSTTPPVTETQAALVHFIISGLLPIVERVATELRAYNQKTDPIFEKFICDPQIWLNAQIDDGASWTFVVEREDNPDFGYHAEFKGPDFIELWAGD